MSPGLGKGAKKCKYNKKQEEGKHGQSEMS